MPLLRRKGRASEIARLKATLELTSNHSVSSERALSIAVGWHLCTVLVSNHQENQACADPNAASTRVLQVGSILNSSH